eukprot:815795-Amphidinium_carterae.1
MAHQWRWLCIGAASWLCRYGLLVQFDLYLRPSEVCTIKRRDLLPLSKRGDAWAIVIRSLPPQCLREAGDGMASDIPVDAKLRKAGDWDSTLLSPDRSSCVGGRQFL